MLQKKIEKDLKKDFKKDVPFDDDLTIQKLTSTTLELTNDEDVMKFTRVP